MDSDKELLKARFHRNMRRVDSLVALVNHRSATLNLAAGTIESEGARADLLRAIIVFLHATFEDMLRTAARQRLGAANSTVLDVVPLSGSSRSGRAEKFYLGALNTHRGKTVDQLIQESVDRSLDQRSFNSCADVEEVLDQMGLDTTTFKVLYPDLDQMMKRRHRIVHSADLTSPKDSDSPQWLVLDEVQVVLWILVVITFHNLLCVTVDPADEVNRWFLASRMKKIELAREVCAQAGAFRGESAESVLGLQRAAKKLSEEVTIRRGPSDEEMLAIWKTMKSPDNETTEEQARAQIAAWRETERRAEPDRLAQDAAG